jgi:glucosamine-6-phosphate deaminase
MRVWISPTPLELSSAAAAHAAASLRHILATRSRARIVAATAASQVAFQRALVAAPGIDWSRVELFQLDEYLGLPTNHPSCFARLLHTHLIDPARVGHWHTIDLGAAHPEDAAWAIGREISTAPIDLAFLGIGENGHLAFNDPPADCVTTQPYLQVTLDRWCRQQQVDEGWFAHIDEVPVTAMTMSMQQMLSALEILVIVPDRRKAAAVRAALTEGVSPSVPASLLRTHPRATLFLDIASASLLPESYSGSGCPLVSGAQMSATTPSK